MYYCDGPRIVLGEFMHLNRNKLHVNAVHFVCSTTLTLNMKETGAARKIASYNSDTAVLFQAVQL